MKHHFFYLVILMGLLASCSSSRNNIISKAYHNTTARYNAYFYAKQNIKEIEKIIEESHDNDYNNILQIYPEIDSVLAKSYATQIEDCIKKASLVIQRHQNSRWVDDSYILIGLARLYSLDYVNAIETFKFVNTNSENPDARHKAIVHLLRTFTDHNEYNNAIAASDYLKKERLNKENSKLLYINRAHFYQTQGDYDNMVQNLVKAAPLLKKKDGKGRIYFIIGQIYQKLGFDAQAFNFYKKCIASNPIYELDFYARLYMARVTQLGKSSDVKAARKLFRKLLKDKKNKEFKDKIYFEMAEFEVRQHNPDKAIAYYKASVRSSISNDRQKGQSYLKLGEIHYDSLANYELAKAYYDSTIAVLPTDFENYKEIKQRQEVLADFVKQLNTIHLQDSLLALSQQDSASIRKQIDEILATERKRLEMAEKKKKQRAGRNNFNRSNENTGIGGTGWYFDNPSAIAMGQNEFRRIWGDRPLEDNWRRSDKESFNVFDNTPTDQQLTGDNKNAMSAAATETKALSAQAEQMFSQIPFSPQAKDKALAQIEEAYYKLGNIYYFKLKEEMNAAETFATLLKRFPATAYEAEVLYQLYLIHKSLGNNTDPYKNKLLSKYPNTTYSKLIANPNYREESTAANEQLKEVYKIAYAYFEAAEYEKAIAAIDQALEEYPETNFTPRLKLLKILITGKTEDINLYQYKLTQFIEGYPDSEITPYAKQLLEASKNFLKKQQRLLGTKFVKYFGQEHYFVVIFEAEKHLTDVIYPLIARYNEKEFSELDLKTSNLILNERYSITMVSGLEDKPTATAYYKKFIAEDVIFEKTQNSKFYKFVITRDNFNIFYQSKDIEAYLRFFEKNYDDEL